MKGRAKKILGMAVAVLLMSLLFSGSVRAYFGSGENGAGGNFNGGELDLRVGNGQTTGALDMGNVAPGTGGTHTYRLENTGRRDGVLSIGVPSVTNIAGTVGKFADGRGDLGRSTQIAFYLDVDDSGDWSQGDIGLSAGGAAYYYQPSLDYSNLDGYDGTDWDGVIAMTAGGRLDLIAVWNIPAAVGNEIQGDSVGFDIVFVLEQPR
ncbi:MAG: hypothetical protein JW856_03740 [Dehalococcoidales bacterium]|nr:hypothetical protein [Dehalococcoidales bacterium]